MSTHRGSRSSGWSDWFPDPNVAGQLYRYRSKRGQDEYQFRPDDNIPRTPIDTDTADQQLTDQLASLNFDAGNPGVNVSQELHDQDLHDDQNQDDNEYTHRNPQTVEDIAGYAAGYPTSSGVTGGYDRNGKGKGKGKGKAKAQEDDDQFQEDEPFYSRQSLDGAVLDDPAALEKMPAENAEPGAIYDGDSSNVPTAADAGQPADGRFGVGWADEYSGAQSDDEELQAAINASMQQAYHENMPGESSTSQAYPAYEPSGDVPDAYPYEAMNEEEAVPEEQTDILTSLPQSIPSRNKAQHIMGTDGDYERLDPRFRVVPSQFYRIGWVFKILWAEPAGQSGGQVKKGFTEHRSIRDAGGKNYYVGFRRFIIIGTDDGQSSCVPIFTYGKQGCKKRGVKPERHGIIYQWGNKPKSVPGEPILGFNPVSLVIEVDGERITKESRVNYSMVYTVQHNVKVFFIGYVEESDFNNVVLPAVDQMWLGQTRTHPGNRFKNSRH